MDQANRVPLRESPRGSSAESDKAPQHITARSRDVRKQQNEHGRENVSNSRVDHYSTAADLESESPARPDDRRTVQSESTSADPKLRPSYSAAVASTIPHSRSSTYAQMSSTTTNSQRQTVSTSRYEQHNHRPTEQRERKLTNAGQHSLISTTATRSSHNGIHGIDFGASAVHAEQSMQGLFESMSRLQQEESQILLECMQKRAGVLESLDQHLKLYIDAFHHVNYENQTMVRERDVQEKRVRALEAQVANLKQQLQVRNQKPIVPVNGYSTHTADGASGADVIGAVQQLNEEVFQFAALLADELLEKHEPVKWNENIQNTMQCMFSDAIAAFVRQAVEKGEHAWIEHALQTCITRCCTGHLTSLIPFRSSVEELYRAMRRAEDQGVSAKWRSLACRYSTKRIAERSKVIRQDVQSMCQALGWPRSHFQSQHAEAIQSITLKTVSLHKMIFTEVLSGDIKVIYPEPGAPFDANTMEINDSRNQYEKPTTEETIACTTDMGLIKSVIEKTHSNGEWKYREWNTVILKAKVALRSSLPGDPNERAEVSTRSGVAWEF